MKMTRKMIKEAREFEARWIKAGRPKKGFKMVMSESMQVERPRVSAIQRFNESYSGKTPPQRTAFATFNAALDTELGKERR